MTITEANPPQLATPTAPPEEVARLIELIQRRRGFDLSEYKRSSLARSIARRAAACKCPTVEAYRDPELFDVLRATVLPDIIARRKTATPPRIRAWSVACATGEEAYSLAIVIFEALDGRLDPVDVKLFATDVDRASLDAARAARYTRDQLENVDARTKRRYFTGTRTPTVRPFLRRLVCFGTHNLVADPPISQLDLITCRNVLIYLEKDAQIAALNNLRYGLVPGGYLVLGKSEKLRPELEAAFEPVDTRWQVYRKTEDGS